jgi:hypothetical protein
MNWGHKIGIVIIVFVIGMLSMVYYASQQTNEMIDDHYYQKELAYQEVIDGKQNLHDLSPDDLITQNEQALIITLPAGSYEHLEKGHIELMRTDAKEKDIQMTITPNGSNQRSIDKKKLTKGIYKARIRWTNEGKEYYKEESVFVR